MPLNHLTPRKPELTRERLVNPYDTPLRQRLIAANAVDLRDNLRIIPLGNGYDRIVPVDPMATIARSGCP